MLNSKNRTAEDYFTEKRIDALAKSSLQYFSILNKKSALICGICGKGGLI